MRVKRVFVSLFSLLTTKKRWVFGIVIIGLLWEFFTTGWLTLVQDENIHLHEISTIISGNFILDKLLTVWPGYHFMMASIIRFLNVTPLWDIRLVSLTIASSSILVFHQLAKQLHPISNHIHIRTLQYAFLPILYPFLGLIYTDGWSILFCLIALQQGLAKRSLVSAIVCALAISIRQTNIVWAAFIGFIVIWQDRPLKEWSLPILSRQSWPFILVFSGFLAVVHAVGTVAVGDRAMHPVAFNLSNIYFFLIINCILFLPLSVKMARPAAKKWQRSLRKWHTALISTVTGSIAFLVYFFTFTDTHPYNTANIVSCIHNIVLYWITSNPFLKTIGFLAAADFFYVLCKAGFKERRFYAWYPCSFFAIVLMPMVEVRYYIIPTSLFILLRRENVQWIEWMIAGLFIGLSLLLLYGITPLAYIP